MARRKDLTHCQTWSYSIPWRRSKEERAGSAQPATHRRVSLATVCIAWQGFLTVSKPPSYSKGFKFLRPLPRADEQGRSTARTALGFMTVPDGMCAVSNCVRGLKRSPTACRAYSCPSQLRCNGFGGQPDTPQFLLGRQTAHRVEAFLGLIGTCILKPTYSSYSA